MLAKWSPYPTKSALAWVSLEFGKYWTPLTQVTGAQGQQDAEETLKKTRAEHKAAIAMRVSEYAALQAQVA